ncbi:hypothetical protein BFG52_13930 [Acinetobacter larvae]|uniref:Uncharacterized protein n=2 Tax=Acinetobacter larvae TaxID=1789224 RepID=A0A1B2M2B7_9GAMM|nr:hypothetical protein BFG52_13930 [Acinetobacter larvae]
MPIVISHLGIIFCAFLGGHESLLNSLIPMISNLLVERIVGFIVLFLLLLLWFAPIFIAFRRSRQQKISR